MSILIDIVPDSVEIDDIEYEINSDFRVSMMFELLMQDKSITDTEKIYIALELYYPETPDNIEQAFEMMLWFYRCGRDIESTGESNGTVSKADMIYSFNYDDEYIYAAFWTNTILIYKILRTCIGGSLEPYLKA